MQKLTKIIEKLEKHINFPAFKEDLRKIGANLITAGIIGVFISHFADLTLGYILATIWVIILGVLGLFFGLSKRGDVK